MMQTTLDSIAMRGAGVIEVLQPVKGHRFTLDSILLADFCLVKGRDRVLEPGAGTGIISLLLARKYPRAHITALEVQASLHDLCARNITANGLSNVTALRADIRNLARSVRRGNFDVLAANPPYARTGTGRTSPDAGRRVSRQGILGGIEPWLDLHAFLKQRGRYAVVFPAARLAELFALMRTRGLEPKRLRLVHPFTDRPASLALIEAVKEGGIGLTVLPPLIVHGPNGTFAEEVRELFQG